MLSTNDRIIVRVVSGGKTLPEYSNKAGVFVVTHPGEIFEVSLKNQLGLPVSVVVTIGGTSVVDGKPITPTSRGYVILPESNFVLKGWRVDTDHIREFVFGDQPVTLKAVFFQIDNGRVSSEKYLKLSWPERFVGKVPLGKEVVTKAIFQPCHRQGKIAFASIALIPKEIVVRKANLARANSCN